MVKKLKQEVTRRLKEYIVFLLPLFYPCQSTSRILHAFSFIKISKHAVKPLLFCLFSSIFASTSPVCLVIVEVRLRWCGWGKRRRMFGKSREVGLTWIRERQEEMKSVWGRECWVEKQRKTWEKVYGMRDTLVVDLTEASILYHFFFSYLCMTVFKRHKQQTPGFPAIVVVNLC